MSRGRALVFVALVAVLGCTSGFKEDPILVLSSAEALAKGKALMERSKYRQAREYLIHAFEVEPNSRGGREALLLAADAYFLQDREDSYVRAESKYRDFQTRFPTSQRADYVQFQIASCLSRRVEKPDRDQGSTLKAVEEFQSVIALYPTSSYVEQARQEIVALRRVLAAHELQIGHFYMRYRNFNGAKLRLQYVLDNFPEFEHTDRVLFLLGMTYRKIDNVEESIATFDRLTHEYPESPFIKQIPRSDSS